MIAVFARGEKVSVTAKSTGRIILWAFLLFRIFLATSIEAASLLEAPIGIPCALRKAKANAPPIKI